MARLDVSRSTKGTIDYLYCTPADDHEKQLLLSVVGARYHEKTQDVWYNADLFIVRDLQRLLRERLVLTAEVETWLATLLTEKKSILHTAHALHDTPLAFEGDTPLRPYQRDAVRWLAEQKRGLLGDEMGLGKSRSALSAAHLVAAKRVLIVTLAIAKWQWWDEIERWFGEGAQAVVVDGTAAERKVLLQGAQKYTIINYDILRDALAKKATKEKPATLAKYPELLRTKWDVVIFDEAHKLQGRHTQQSEAAEAIARPTRTSYVFELTGTPIWDMPDSLWHLLHILDPTVLSSYHTFIDKYCTINYTDWGKVVTGIHAHRRKELKERLSHYLLQRLKHDVAPELPDKIYTTLSYDLSTRQHKDYQRLKKELRIQYEEDKGDRHFANVVSATIALRKLCNNPHDLDLNYDSPKDGVLTELVDNMLKQTEKIAILCWHKDYADHIKMLLEAKGIVCTLATGAEQAIRRIVRVGAFKESPARVLIGTIAAIGTALNLGYITNVIFAELDWTPPMNRQAENRFHRMTSIEHVNIFYLIGRGTIEQHIVEVTRRKSSIADETLAIQAVVQALLAEP